MTMKIGIFGYFCAKPTFNWPKIMSKKGNASFTFENWDNNGIMGKWAIETHAKGVNRFLTEQLK